VKVPLREIQLRFYLFFFYRSKGKPSLHIKNIYEVTRTSEESFHGQKTGPFFHSSSSKSFVGILSRYVEIGLCCCFIAKDGRTISFHVIINDNGISNSLIRIY